MMAAASVVLVAVYKPADAAQVIAPDAVLDAHTADTPEFVGAGSAGPSVRFVQIFKAQNTGLLTDAQARISHGPGYTADITAQIVTIPTAETPSRVLAETTIPGSSVVEEGLGFPPASTLATVSFGEGVPVTAGQTYGLALRKSGLGLNWNVADPRSTQNSDAYPDGRLMTATGDDIFYWQDVTPSGTLDGIFSIYVVPSPIGPKTKVDCKDGGYKDFGFKNQGKCIASLPKASKQQ
jgi:hypothetical protein